MCTYITYLSLTAPAAQLRRQALHHDRAEPCGAPRRGSAGAILYY